MGVPLGIQVYFDKKRLVEQSLRDMSSLFHDRLLAVVTWTGWLWPWQERLRDSLEAGFLQADLFQSFKKIMWRTFKLEFFSSDMPTEAINMPWSFYWPLITIMIFKNQSNQTVSIQLIRRWEESKTVKVSNLKPEKTTTDLGGNYCNGIITMSPNSFNVQSSVIADICLLLSNQAKRHIAPGCQLVDVTMNSPSPNGLPFPSPFLFSSADQIF